MASPHVLLLLLADARLPVAGHTQSGGLEAAVRDGLAANEVPRYVASRLASVTRVEAGTAVVARHRLLAGLPLGPVLDGWAARTPSPALRAVARTQGTAFLRLARRLWPQSVHLGACPDATPRAVVLAAAAATAGIDARSLARLVGYDDVQTVCSAALKLLPLDPATVTGWVHQALPAVDDLAEAVAPLTEPTAVPASAAPQTELWAQAHTQTTRRLFSA